MTREEQDAVNERNAAFEVEIYGEDEFMSVFDPEAPDQDWTWQTAAQIADELNSHYHGLNVRSESIGMRIIPRVEKRTGRNFERKIARVRRLILCPPTRMDAF